MHTVGATVSRRTQTICFVSEAIWSERSHEGIEQRVKSSSCILTYEAVHRQGKGAPLTFTPPIPKEEA